jgi:cation diffusion facilitator family transporter
MLGDDNAHHHNHADDDDDHHHHSHAHDHNMRAAYVHVLADALTSVLAISALLAGMFFGWVWMDPLMGIVGACVIATRSWSLIRSSGAVLLDVVPDAKLAKLVRDRIEIGNDRVADLHVWRVGPGHTAIIAAVVSDEPQAPEAYKARLDGVLGLSHVTVEVHRCH